MWVKVFYREIFVYKICFNSIVSEFLMELEKKLVVNIERLKYVFYFQKEN